LKDSIAKILILSNVPPLIGFLFYGWRLKEVILLYWLETIVIGLFSILISLVSRPSPDAAAWLSKHGNIALGAYKAAIAILMTILVGVYTLVTSLIVAFLLLVTEYGFDRLPEAITLPEYLYHQMSAQNIWLALGVVLLSHLTAFIYRFVIKREYLTYQDRQQMDLLASRVGAIVYTVVPSMIILVILVSLEGTLAESTLKLLHAGPAALLIVFKTYFEYQAHKNEFADR